MFQNRASLEENDPAVKKFRLPRFMDITEHGILSSPDMFGH